MGIGVPPYLSRPRQVANAPYGREARAVVVGFVTVCICETYGSQKKDERLSISITKWWFRRCLSFNPTWRNDPI